MSPLSAFQRKMRHKSAAAVIRVELEGVEVATLEPSATGYRFRYQPEFARRGLAALPGLPQPEQTEWRELPDLPKFFQERIPDLERPEIRNQMTQLGISSDDTIALLGKLSRRAVTDPFELVLGAAA